MADTGSSSSHNKKSTLQQFLNSTTHVVVDFHTYKKSCLALVLRTWLREAKTTWHCQYPKGIETEIVEEEYVKLNTAPEKDWPKYKVKVLQEASSFEQGKRRLERLLEGKDAYASNLKMLEKIPVIAASGTNDKNVKNNKSGDVVKDQKSRKGDDVLKHNKSHKKRVGKYDTANESGGIDERDKGDRSSDNDDLNDSKMSVDDDQLDHGNKRDDENSSNHNSSEISDRTRSISGAEHNDSESGSSTTSSSGENSGKSRENVSRLANRGDKPSIKRQPATKRQLATKRQPSTKLSRTEIETEMKKMQEVICKKIDNLKKSWLNELRHQFADLTASVTPSEKFRAVGEALNNCKKTLDTNFPIEGKQEFLALEAALVNDEEKSKALKTYMQLLQNGSKTTKDSVAQILSALMSKSLQLTFSGAGRVTNGVGKDNFSATQMFKALSDLLMEIHSCSCAEVRCKTGKWLAGAGDRNGGKRERELKALNRQ